MAGKARVHELAKELGVTSKEVLARLSEQGEFVKSASSTVEAPVARRLRESFGGAKPAAEKVKADGNGAPAKKAAAKAPAPEKAPAAKPSRAAGTAARARRARSPGRGSGSGGTRTGAPRPDPRSPARRSDAGSQAGGAHPARRQQPVLLGTACRPADSPAAGTPSGCAAARRRPASRRLAGQYAAPSRWRRARPSGTSRWPAARSRWTRPRRLARRSPRRRWRRR